MLTNETASVWASTSEAKASTSAPKNVAAIPVWSAKTSMTRHPFRPDDERSVRGPGLDDPDASGPMALAGDLDLAVDHDQQ